MEVRRARETELAVVMTILDGGLLEASAPAIEAAIESGRVLVAVDGGPVLGALVWCAEDSAEGIRIQAIAVRPGRRGQGIGTALVRAAATRHGRLVAEFDAGVRRFWDAMGFEVESADEPERYVGWLEADG